MVTGVVPPPPVPPPVPLGEVVTGADPPPEPLCDDPLVWVTTGECDPDLGEPVLLAPVDTGEDE